MSFSDLFSSMSPGHVQLGLGVADVFTQALGAGDALQDKYDAQRMQMDQFNQGFGAYLDAMMAQREENEYIRMREELDRATRASERDFAIDQLYGYLDTLADERGYMLDRQGAIDADAARNRQFALEQMLRNQALSADERRFAIEQLLYNRDIAANERDFSMDIFRSEADRFADRQALLDEDARRMQFDRMREADRNRELLQDERNFARELLADARSTADREAKADLDRFTTARDQRMDERDFLIDQYELSLMQAQREREEERMIRELQMRGADRLRDGLEDFASELGYVPEIMKVTPEMIEEEARIRGDEYAADIDRAAQMVASSGQADLIRSGLDVSTTGDDLRGKIAARLGQEYEGARRRAYDDAVKYISGVANTTNSQVNAELDRRNAMMAEKAGILTSDLNILQNLRTLPSSVGAYQQAGNIASGVYDRGVTSAAYSAPVALSSALYDSSGLIGSNYSNADYNLMNLLSGISSAGNYTSPVSISSGIYDNMLAGSSLGSTLNYGSGASTAGMNVMSSILNPYNQTLSSPNSYYSSSTGSQNNYISSLMGNYNSWAGGVSDSFSNFGSLLGDFSLDSENGGWAWSPQKKKDNA